MGKLMDRLEKQLKNPELRKDAEDCIKIFNWIKGNTVDGHVWSSSWWQFVDVRFSKKYPNNERIYKPNNVGYTLLKGMD
jgi:hypothetical protein